MSKNKKSLNTAGRGQGAQNPLQVPAKGWKDIGLRTFGEINNDRVTLIAAGVTYFLLSALFPAVTAVVSIYGIFADPSTVAKQMSALSGVVPSGGLDIINDQLTRVTQQGAPTLGLALIISLGLALWSASAGVKSLFEAMNIAYDAEEKRNFFVLNAVALLFTLAGVVAAVVMIGVVIAMPVVLSFLFLGNGVEWLVQVGGYVVVALMLVTGIAALYRWGPNRHGARWKWITPGAILSVVIIGIVSLLYSWYAANFAHYDKTYGSLGALIGFLFWLWITITVVIVGAELNSEIEHQAKPETAPPDDQTSGAVKKSATGASDANADPNADRSDEWRAGYQAALRQQRRQRGGSLPLAYAIPAALVMGALRGNKDKQR